MLHIVLARCNFRLCTLSHVAMGLKGPVLSYSGSFGNFSKLNLHKLLDFSMFRHIIIDHPCPIVPPRFVIQFPLWRRKMNTR